MLIRRLKYEEIALLRGFAPPDWHFYLEQFMKFHLDQPYFVPLIADFSGNVVGVGNGICNGSAGWIGNIIVTEEFRRKGIGTAITQGVIRELEKMKCRSFLLIATHDGIPLYRKLGFSQESNYCFYQIKKILQESPNPHIRSINESDFDELLKMDFQATGELRESLINRVLETGLVYFDKKTEGFYLPEFGQGYIVARNHVAGLSLLSYKLSTKPGILVIPEQNFAANTFVEKMGYPETNISPRMMLGKNLCWKPSMIYSRAAGYCG